MAGTKAQREARQRRLDRAAEVLYYQSTLRPRVALIEPVWEDLTEEEKTEYRTLAELAVTAYEANPA